MARAARRVEIAALRADLKLAARAETDAATVAESALSGADASSVAEATSNADEGTSPSSDIAASAEYRRHLARVLTRRAVEEALSR